MISKFYFNAFLVTESDIKNYLQDKETGSAHPLSSENKLIVKTESGFEKQDIGEHAQYLSNANLASVEDRVVAALDKYDHLSGVKNYSVQFSAPGQPLVVSEPKNLFSFIVTDKKDGNYFDFVAYYKKGNQINTTTYSAKSSTVGFQHSGDVGALLHTINIAFPQMPENTPFLLAAIGFRKRQIRCFQDQVPVFFVVDHERETINMMPVPLDQATVGTASMVGLVVGMRVHNTIKMIPLTSPVTVDSVDTGDLSQRTKGAVQNCFDRNRDDLLRAVEQVEHVQQVEESPSVQNHENADMTTLKPIVEFIEAGLQSPFDFDSTKIGFGTGFSEPLNDAAEINLPHLFGSCDNSASLALGTQPSVNFDVNSECVTIVHLSDKWRDSVVPSCKWMGNAIFIIHPSKPIKDENDLNELCVNGLVMAGPLSIVLVKTDDDYVWYRGCSLPCLIESVPTFGQIIPDVETNIKKIMPTSFSSICVQKGSKNVRWNDELMNIMEVVQQLVEFSIDDIEKRETDVLDFLAQLSVLLTPSELKEMSAKIDKHLMHLVDSECEKKKEKMLKYRDSKNFKIEKFIEISKDFSAYKKKIVKRIQTVSNAIANLVSVQGVSSRNQDIKRRMRKTKIYDNVAKSKNMTIEQKCEMLDDVAQECGVLFTNVQTELTKIGLKAVGESRFLQIVASGQVGQVAVLNPRMGVLDSLTTGTLLELGAGSNHFLSGSQQCIAIPAQQHSQISSLPFVLLDRHVKCEDPGQLHWPEECNIEQVAMWRIMTRGTISEATSCREFHISAASKDLGFFIAEVIISTMESIVSGMSTKPTKSSNWNDTNCQILRGLFGQLFSLFGSGVKPLTTLFQFVKPNPSIDAKLSNGEIVMLARIVKVFEYTCWSTENLKKNVKSLVIRYLRQKITDPVTEAMRKDLTAFEQEKLVDYMEKRNEELKWLDVATEIMLSHVKKPGDVTKKSKLEEIEEAKHRYDTNRGIAQRLLELYPQDGNHKDGTLMVHDFFVKMSKGKASWKGKYSQVVQIALNIFTKRSACFKDIKKELYDTLENYGDVAPIVAKFKQMLSDMQTGEDVEEVHVQNYEKTVDTPEFMGLKSDAELARTPWSVTGDGFDEDERMAKIDYVLGLKESYAVEPKSQAVVVQEKPAVIVALENGSKNQKALTLARALPEVTAWNLLRDKVADVDSCFGKAFVSLIQFAFCNVDAIKDIVHVHLLEWRDVTAAETKCLTL